jgi:hypothetical protein
MSRGSIIGSNNSPNISTAKGIWDLNEQRNAKAANNWPFGTRAEILTTVSSTTDSASYTFNNISLGTPSPSRRIFFHTPTDYLPTGNLNFSSTWTTPQGTYNSTLTPGVGLGQGFAITPDFSVYIGRYFSFLSDIIPTALTGNLSVTVSTDGATATGLAPTIFALHNINNLTATTILTGIGPHTLTDFVPGSISIVFQTVYDAEAVPTITGSPLPATFLNNNTRTVDASTMKSVIYVIQNDTSSTVSQTISSTSTTQALRLYRFR